MQAKSASRIGSIRAPPFFGTLAGRLRAVAREPSPVLLGEGRIRAEQFYEFRHCLLSTLVRRVVNNDQSIARREPDIAQRDLRPVVSAMAKNSHRVIVDDQVAKAIALCTRAMD